jgi:CRISPR-associated protein (TIGR02584 family)
MGAANLLFVAGASPQIITETVYALVQRGNVVPTQVRVLTTTAGRERIRSELFETGAAWQRLRNAYPQARRFRFGARRVEVLKGADGRLLDDVRSDADNAAAADQIVSTVAALTRDGEPALHASIAGGRKTMGYLLAAAMMLHGRAEDRLSHVLVRPAKLEGTNFFFPPPPRSAARQSYRGPAGKAVHVARDEIAVELAELPFPRLRAIGDVRERSGLSFSTFVAQLQEEIDILTAARVSVQVNQSLVICGTRAVHLSPVRSSIYALLAEHRRQGCGHTACQGCAKCFVAKEDIESSFRQQLSLRMRALASHAVGDAAWGVKNFLPEVPKINATLRRCLKGGSAPYEIRTWGPKGDRHHGLVLRPDAITVMWD